MTQPFERLPTRVGPFEITGLLGTEVPDSDVAHRILAAILMGRNEVTAAVQHAERAVALNPGDAASRDLLGVTLAAQGRPDQAALQFREAVRLDPSDDTARKHLEQVLHQ